MTKRKSRVPANPQEASDRRQEDQIDDSDYNGKLSDSRLEELRAYWNNPLNFVKSDGEITSIEWSDRRWL